MVQFEGQERRMPKIQECLGEYGISSLEEAKSLCAAKGIDVEAIVKGVQPIAFENAVWAYTLGVAVALKKQVKTAAEAAEAIGIGLQAWGLIACTLINVLKKRREALLGVPVLVLLIGLWLGTPVYSDFRYAYPFFLTLPFLLTATAFSPEPAPVTEPAEKQELVIAALQSNMEK